MENDTNTQNKKICKCVYVMNTNVTPKNSSQNAESFNTSTDKQDKTDYNNTKKNSLYCDCDAEHTDLTPKVQTGAKEAISKTNSEENKKVTNKCYITPKELVELEFYRWWTSHLAEKQSEDMRKCKDCQTAKETRFSSCSCSEAKIDKENKSNHKKEKKNKQSKRAKQQKKATCAVSKSEERCKASSKTNCAQTHSRTQVEPPHSRRAELCRQRDKKRTIKYLQRLYDTPCSSVSVLCNCKLPASNIADCIADARKRPPPDVNVCANFGRSYNAAAQNSGIRQRKASCIYDSKSCVSEVASMSCCDYSYPSESSSADESNSDDAEDSCCCCRGGSGGKNNNCCCCCCCCCCCRPARTSKAAKQKKAAKREETTKKRCKKVLCRAQCNAAHTQTNSCVCADGCTQTANMTKHRTAGCQCGCAEKKGKKKHDPKGGKRGNRCCCKSKRRCCCCPRVMMCPCVASCCSKKKDCCKEDSKEEEESTDGDYNKSKRTNVSNAATDYEQRADRTYVTNRCLVTTTNNKFNGFSNTSKMNSFQTPISGRVVNFTFPRANDAVKNKSKFSNAKPYQHLEPFDPNEFAFLATTNAAAFNSNPISNEEEHRFLLTAVCGAIMSNRDIRNRNVSALLDDPTNFSSFAHTNYRSDATEHKQRNPLRDRFCAISTSYEQILKKKSTDEGAARNTKFRTEFRTGSRNSKCKPKKRHAKSVGKHAYGSLGVGKNVRVDISNTSIVIEETRSAQTSCSQIEIVPRATKKTSTSSVERMRCRQCTSYSDLVFNPIQTTTTTTRLGNAKMKTAQKRNGRIEGGTCTNSDNESSIIANERKLCLNVKRIEKCSSTKRNYVAGQQKQQRGPLLSSSDHRLYESLVNKYNLNGGTSVRDTLKNSFRAGVVEHSNDSQSVQRTDQHHHKPAKSGAITDYDCLNNRDVLINCAINRVTQSSKRRSPRLITEPFSDQNRVRFDCPAIESDSSSLPEESEVDFSEARR